MEKIVTEDNGKFYVTGNDLYLASVLADLARNNTAFPEVVDVYAYKKNNKDVIRLKFADDMWTDVTRSKDDKDDPVMGVLYGIAKRLFGKPKDCGYVLGDGFMTKIKTLVGNIRTEETEEKARKERVKAKEEADRKAHEEAVRRRQRNPSLGYRLGNLEKKFETLVDLLAKKESRGL